MRTHWRLALVSLAFILLTLPCIADQTVPGDWQKVEKDGIVIMCEQDTRELAEQLLPEISKRIEKNRKEGAGAQIDLLVKQKKEVLQFIATQLGMDKPGKNMNIAFDGFADMGKRLRDCRRFRIWRKEKVKEILASGQSLPGFTYDPATDKVSGTVSFSNKNHKDVEYPIGLKQDEKATDFQQAIKQLDEKVFMPAEVIIHETSEAGIIYDFKQSGAFRRWFCDGAAEYVNVECTRRFLGEDAARKWQKDRDDLRNKDFADQVDLLNWRASEWEKDSGYEMDDKLTNAHYSFALYEMQELVKRHGPETLARICREIAKSEDDPKDQNTIMLAVVKTTGEDMNLVLAKYGSKSPDPFKGIAINSLTLVAFEENSQHGLKKQTETNKIPLIFDNRHGFAFLYKCAAIKTPVVFKTKLELTNATDGDEFNLTKSEAEVNGLQIHFTDRPDYYYKPGSYVIKIMAGDKVIKEVPFECVEPAKK